MSCELKLHATSVAHFYLHDKQLNFMRYAIAPGLILQAKMRFATMTYNRAFICIKAALQCATSHRHDFK